MKFNGNSASGAATLALSLLSSASALRLPSFLGDVSSSIEQVKFQFPSELGNLNGLSSYAHIDKKQVAHLMEKLANDLGQSWHDVPSSAIDAWYEVLKSTPQAFPQLRKELTHQLKLAREKNMPITDLLDFSWIIDDDNKPHHHKDKSHKAHHKSKSHHEKSHHEKSHHDKAHHGKKTSPSSEVEWIHIVENDKFPSHTLKVKSPESLGVDTVKQYSGYLDDSDQDKHYFYWFFESRNDPKNDPVVLWLNGGPGCSSLTGLFFELGPSSIGADLKPIYNPYSWNSNASVIFLDQPVNTGYSYSDSSQVSDTVTAGKDVYAFLSLFFQQFPEYNGDLPFHIAGESYAGHYIPVFASEILSHEDRIFNLSSVLIGNGLTDPLHQYDYYEPMACGEGGEPSVLSEDECEGMISAQPRCNNLISACYNTQSAWTCVPATVYCNNAMMGPYQRTGKNVYDIRTDCEGGSLCYTNLEDIDKYLNLPEVKAAVGAEVDTYTSCNFDTNRNFVFAGDWMKPYYTAVTELLEKDIPVLIYAGDKDFICNWLGNEAWSRQLEWSGSDKFSTAPLIPWTLNGKEVGQVRNTGSHFTFLRVYGAGHMVPFDQPEASLDLLNRWISGDFTYN